MNFMAERLAQLPHIGRPSIYPWSTWMDGSVWRIRRGEDYAIPTKTMAQVIRSHAWRNGRSVSAYVNRELDAVEFQFMPVEEMAA